jgi:hypothetical protein
MDKVQNNYPVYDNTPLSKTSVILLCTLRTITCVFLANCNVSDSVKTCDYTISIS